MYSYIVNAAKKQNTADENKRWWFSRNILAGLPSKPFFLFGLSCLCESMHQNRSKSLKSYPPPFCLSFFLRLLLVMLFIITFITCFWVCPHLSSTAGDVPVCTLSFLPSRRNTDPRTARFCHLPSPRFPLRLLVHSIFPNRTFPSYIPISPALTFPFYLLLDSNFKSHMRWYMYALYAGK